MNQFKYESISHHIPGKGLTLSVKYRAFIVLFYYTLFVYSLIITMGDNWNRIQIRLACVLKHITCCYIVTQVWIISAVIIWFVN